MGGGDSHTSKDHYSKILQTYVSVHNRQTLSALRALSKAKQEVPPPCAHMTCWFTAAKTSLVPSRLILTLTSVFYTGTWCWAVWDILSEWPFSMGPEYIKSDTWLLEQLWTKEGMHTLPTMSVPQEPVSGHLDLYLWFSLICWCERSTKKSSLHQKWNYPHSTRLVSLDCPRTYRGRKKWFGNHWKRHPWW